jgi:hypothetical protein
MMSYYCYHFSCKALLREDDNEKTYHLLYCPSCLAEYYIDKNSGELTFLHQPTTSSLFGGFMVREMIYKENQKILEEKAKRKD